MSEYGSLTLALTPDEYRLLRLRYTGKLDVTPTATPGLYTLSARDHIGRIKLSPRLLLLIRPKVPVANLLHMLSVDADLAWFHLPNIALDTTNDVSLLLVSALITESERLVESGIRADFTPREESLSLVRGRIALTKQIARYGDLKHRHVCSYAEQTPDTPENRVLAAALRQANALLSREDAPLLRRARGLIPAFGGVERITSRQAVRTLSNIRLHRLNTRYATALGLCALVLNHLSLADHQGEHPFPSFLVDMPRLFESYLTARLRALLPSYGLRVVAQRHDYLDEAGRVRIRPDILIYPRRGTTPLLVVDAKYRTPAVGDNSSDLYQIGAYMSRYRLTSGALVYPQPEDSAPTELRLRGTGKRLHLLHLDLAVPDASALDADCARLADEVARLATL